MDLEFEKEIVEVERRIAELNRLNADPKANFDAEIAELTKKLEALRRSVYAGLSPWQTVQIARHKDRPLLQDYIAGMFREFIELHGDRCYADDRGIIGGFARLDKRRVMLIGHQKGRTVEENIKANFGMANPDGYRKALRLMKLAEKYGLPVVTLIDTPGAYPGMEAEARGQAEAIARNLTEMSALEVPVVAVITGEGGSGGAIGIGVGDAVLMLSNAIYSVISPEGCASILWRDGSQAPRAAEALKLTAPSLLELGIIDEIVPEPPGGAHRDHKAVMAALRDALLRHLRALASLSPRKLVERRYEKYTRMGRRDARAERRARRHEKR
ncbi:MAG: acetyl-CoA carboxylase carboxyltransferase subunit alpha [Lentisphaerae bacterium]|nr:acetyl-CoA carboxylase carboxyltransferase subunit alpha [Lentisphaerota bacterium]